jgi:hypothetical protein
MSETPGSTDPHQAGRYEIRLQGHLGTRWAAAFDGLEFAYQSDGSTVIHGPVADQAALHGLLRKVRDVGLPLLSVVHVELDQLDRTAPNVRSAASPRSAKHEGN